MSIDNVFEQSRSGAGMAAEQRQFVWRLQIARS